LAATSKIPADAALRVAELLAELLPELRFVSGHAFRHAEIAAK
jgi:hypothetical protein